VSNNKAHDSMKKCPTGKGYLPAADPELVGTPRYRSVASHYFCDDTRLRQGYGEASRGRPSRFFVWLKRLEAASTFSGTPIAQMQSRDVRAKLIKACHPERSEGPYLRRLVHTWN
jgi:hypothetical protein